MSAVPGHFLDRKLPVVEHSEYATVRQRHGSIWFAEIRCLPASCLHQVQHNFAEIPRNPSSTIEIENEIAVMLINQVFQLLLDRLTLSSSSDIVAQGYDDDLPD